MSRFHRFWQHRFSGCPGRCQVCGRWPAQPVCDACLDRHATTRARCMRCACPLPHAGPQLCGACTVHPGPSSVQHCVAALDYDHPWDRLIGRWKFHGETGWSGLWADLMLQAPGAQDLWQRSRVAVPVPVGPSRLAERGYNQSWELLKALRRRGPPGHPACLPDALLRVRETIDQHALPRAQRLRNLQGVFLPHPDRQVWLAGATVLLVDDVSTTGATLEAAAQALLGAGASRVDALVLARTPAPE